MTDVLALAKTTLPADDRGVIVARKTLAAKRLKTDCAAQHAGAKRACEPDCEGCELDADVATQALFIGRAIGRE